MVPGRRSRSVSTWWLAAAGIPLAVVLMTGCSGGSDPVSPTRSATPPAESPTATPSSGADSPAPVGSNDPAALTQADTGRTIAVKAGDSVKIQLLNAWLWGEPTVDGDAVTATRVDYRSRSRVHRMDRRRPSARHRHAQRVGHAELRRRQRVPAANGDLRVRRHQLSAVTTAATSPPARTAILRRTGYAHSQVASRSRKGRSGASCCSAGATLERSGCLRGYRDVDLGDRPPAGYHRPVDGRAGHQRPHGPGARRGEEPELAGGRGRHLGGELTGGVEQPHVTATRRAVPRDDAGITDSLTRRPPRPTGLPSSLRTSGTSPQLDRHADERAVLGPRAVVVLDVRLVEDLVQHEPGVRRALADAAVGDGVLAEVDARVAVQRAQLVVRAERAVVVRGLAPRDVLRRRDVAADAATAPAAGAPARAACRRTRRASGRRPG